MNGILKKTATFLLGLVLVVPSIEAQQRTSGHRGGSKSEQVSSRGRSGGESNRKPQATRPSSSRPSSGRPANTTSRPGNSGSVNNRPGNNGNHNQGVSNRPGNNGNHQNVGNRPGNNGNHNQGVGNRPGNNGNHNQGVGNRPGHNGNHNQGVGNRPGNNGNHNQGIGNRPGHNGNHNQGMGNRPNRPDRPVTGVRPGHNARPPHNNAVRPGHNYRPPYVQRPPMHVHRPAPRPWHRPVPPPAWRPRPGAPVISAIFGINFGTALNVSLNFLLGHGYTVSSYGSNAVYLSDVNQYNYYWPEATMYYGNNGLERTEFFYSTSYPDTVRYNNLYNNMTAIYGAPVNVSNVSSSLSATWFAPNQGYIRLQYVPQYSSGQLRFFTSITTGL